MNKIYDFDTSALYDALDQQRQDRELSWTGVARELWALSSELNDTRRDHPFSASTFSSMHDRHNTSCQHALFMLRWLNRTPESFLAGAPSRDDDALPSVGPDRRLRWRLTRLYEALNLERQEQSLTWPDLAKQLGATPSQLTGLRTAKFATNMVLAMRIVQWLGRPAADFVYAAKW